MQFIFLKADNGLYKKGDCIEIRASSTPFTGLEPSKFVMVEVTNTPIDSYDIYRERWERIIDYEVVNSNPSIDGFRIRLYSPLYDSSGNGKITLAEVQTFVENWGGSIFSSGDNEVVFDVLIYDAICSPNFWEIPIDDIVFTENSYTEATGIHEVEIDFSALGNNPTYVERYVMEKGGTIISNVNKVITAEFHRSDVRTLFQEDIKEKAKKLVFPYRYYIGSGVVDYIVGQGNSITTDLTTLLGYLHDKTED